MSNSCIWPIDRTLSNVTTPDQSGPESDGNEEVLHIPQTSSTVASSSDDLMSYSGHSLGKSYPSAVMQLAYSTAPADWAGWKISIGYLKPENTLQIINVKNCCLKPSLFTVDSNHWLLKTNHIIAWKKRLYLTLNNLSRLDMP